MLTNYHPNKTYQIDSNWRNKKMPQQLHQDWTETFLLESLSTKFIFTMWKIENKKQYQLVLISFESDCYHSEEEWSEEIEYIMSIGSTNSYMFNHFKKEIEEEWDRFQDGHLVNSFETRGEMMLFIRRWQQRILDSVEERYKQERTVLETAQAQIK